MAELSMNVCLKLLQLLFIVGFGIVQSRSRNIVKPGKCPALEPFPNFKSSEVSLFRNLPPYIHYIFFHHPQNLEKIAFIICSSSSLILFKNSFLRICFFSISFPPEWKKILIIALFYLFPLPSRIFLVPTRNKRSGGPQAPKSAIKTVFFFFLLLLKQNNLLHVNFTWIKTW